MHQDTTKERTWIPVEVLDHYMLMAVLGKPLAGTLAQVHEKVEALGASEDAFVEAILARIPPVPPNHHRIVESNEAGLLPGRSHGPRGGREPLRGLLAI